MRTKGISKLWMMVAIIVGWIGGSLVAIAINLRNPQVSPPHETAVSDLASVTASGMRSVTDSGALEFTSPERFSETSIVDEKTIQLLALTADEERQISDLVDQTVTKLREWETSRFEQRGDLDPSHKIQVTVPGDPGKGAQLRESFLNQIRDVIGEQRSYLFISNAQEAFQKRFGSYGAEDKIVSVSIEDGQYWFHERDGKTQRYFRSTTIHERFTHLFALKK